MVPENNSLHKGFLTSPTCAANDEKGPVLPQGDLSILSTLSETCAITEMETHGY